MVADPSSAETPAGSPSEGTRSRDLHQLGRQGALNLLGTLVSAALTFALPILVTRSLPQDEAGLFFQCTALFALVLVVGVLGADTSLLRFVPHSGAEQNGRRVGVLLRTAVGPPLVCATVLAAAAIYAADPIARLLHDGDRTDDAIAGAIYVLAAMLPVAVLYNLLLATTRGMGSVFPLVVIDKVGRGALQVLLCASALVLGFSIPEITAAWSAPYVVALIATVLWMLRRAPAWRRPHLSAPTSPNLSGGARNVFAEFWRFSLPRATSRVFSVALQRVDILLVGVLRGAEDAALYAAVTRFTILGLMFVQALQQVMAPRISEFLASGATDRARSIYQATTAWLMLVSWPIYLLCAVFAGEMLDLFGEEYDDAAEAVVVLCLIMLVATACGPVDMVLLMGGRSVLSLINTGCALATMVLLDLWLIPNHGVVGAAVGWACAIAVNNLLPLWQVHRTMDMHPVSGAAVRAAGISGLGFIVALATRVSGEGNVPTLLVAAFLCLACYALGLWRCREKLELGALLAVARRRR